MRSKYVIAVFIVGTLFVLSAIPSSAQLEWKEQKSDTGRWTQRTLKAISFVDDAVTGWAIGASGEVLYTSNSGSVWTPQTPGLTANDLHGLDMVDATHGWTVGREGFVGATTDGSNWAIQDSAREHAHFQLRDVDFVDTMEGWVVGDCKESQGVHKFNGTLIHTTDGGITWEKQYAILTDNFNSIFMANNMIGWISADNGAILHTEDGGESWVNQTTGITRHLHDIFFISPTNGWSVGTAGNILATEDGGLTWTKQESGSSLQLYSVMFKDENNGIVVGERGTVLVTDDSGSTWTPEASGTGEGLHDVYMGQSISFITGDAGLILTRGGPTVSSFPTDLVPVITTIIILGIAPLAVLRRINRKRV